MLALAIGWLFGHSCCARYHRVLVKWQPKRQRKAVAAVDGIRGLGDFRRMERRRWYGISSRGRTELAPFSAINSLPLTASHRKPLSALALPSEPLVALKTNTTSDRYILSAKMHLELYRSSRSFTTSLS